jgi:PilZ domain
VQIWWLQPKNPNSVFLTGQQKKAFQFDTSSLGDGCKMPAAKWVQVPLEKSKDRRQFGRRSVFKVAMIAQSGNQRLRVAITDISNGGARIKASNPELIENDFFLEIPADDFVVKCQLVWLEDGSAGAKFVKAPRRLSWNNKWAASVSQGAGGVDVLDVFPVRANRGLLVLGIADIAKRKSRR